MISNFDACSIILFVPAMSKQTKPLTDEQQQLANGLSHQTIFTEEGWKKYIPASLLTLKKMVPGISVAGNRMAGPYPFSSKHKTSGGYAGHFF